MTARLELSSDGIVHRAIEGQDAYDSWHLALYMKEILEYRRLIAIRNTDLALVPRKEKNLLVYLLLRAGKYKSVLELGSSLFEIVDGLMATARCFNDDSVVAVVPDLLQYRGIELSEFLGKTSKELHPWAYLDVVNNVDNSHGCDVLYDRAVSSYAFETVDQLVKFLSQAKAGILNLFLSRGETFSVMKVGRKQTYFSANELKRKLPDGVGLIHLFGNKAPGSVVSGDKATEGFYLYADRELAEAFDWEARQSEAVMKWFKEKGIYLNLANDNRILPQTNPS